jgi:predicted membrane protein
MTDLIGKKITAVVVNVCLAVIFFLLLCTQPERFLLTMIVLWVFAVTCLGSLIYFLYWVPKNCAKNEKTAGELHHDPQESHAL